MKGTAKQTARAEEIKTKIMTALDAMANTAMKEQFDDFRAWLDNKDSAAWWIDSWQMTKTEHMFLRSVMREYKA